MPRKPPAWSGDLGDVIDAARGSGYSPVVEVGEDGLERLRMLVYTAGTLLIASPDRVSDDAAWLVQGWTAPVAAFDERSTIELAVEVARADRPRDPDWVSWVSPDSLDVQGSVWSSLDILWDRFTFEEPDVPVTVGGAYVLDALVHETHVQRTRLAREWLSERVPDLVVESAGGIVPFQAGGTIQGYEFYFRFRGGRASLDVGGDDPVAMPLWSAAVSHGHSLDGALYEDEFARLFVRLLSMLETAPFLYRFDCWYGDDLSPVMVELGSAAPLQHGVSGGGLSVEEALARAMASARLRGIGGDRGLVLTTDDVDSRVFPSEMPRWLVEGSTD